MRSLAEHRKDLDEYYNEVYLPLHQKTANRLLHLIGTLMTFVVGIYGLATLNPALVLLAPFIVYAFAWPGHYFIEGNKPAALNTNPLYARLSDWRMCWEFVTRKI